MKLFQAELNKFPWADRIISIQQSAFSRTCSESFPQRGIPNRSNESLRCTATHVSTEVPPQRVEPIRNDRHFHKLTIVTHMTVRYDAHINQSIKIATSIPSHFPCLHQLTLHMTCRPSPDRHIMPLGHVPLCIWGAVAQLVDWAVQRSKGWRLESRLLGQDTEP